MTEPDEYQRIYKGCQNHPLFLVMHTLVEAGASQVRKTDPHFATDWGSWSERDKIKRLGLHFELVHDVARLSDILQEQYDAVFGPRLITIGPRKATMDEGHIIIFNFDRHNAGGTFKLDKRFEWDGSGLDRAARAYRRCCGWDFSPDEAGIWLCYYLLTSGMGGSQQRTMTWSGNIVGFVILHDRDKDRNYESLAHVWTASGARRKGVASRLIQYAREQFPLRDVEGPLTEDGKALVTRVWPQGARE